METIGLFDKNNTYFRECEIQNEDTECQNGDGNGSRNISNGTVEHVIVGYRRNKMDGTKIFKSGIYIISYSDYYRRLLKIPWVKNK